MKRQSRFSRFAFVPQGILLALGAVLLFQTTALAGEVVDVDGVPHVRNPAEPPGGIETLELEEIWRVGGDEGELLLGLPTGLDVDAAGRIYILDAQLNQVHVVSPDGEVLATRSREGDGPGEMRNPSDLIVWPDGGIGVVQEYPGYVIRLDGDGDPLPSLHPGGATEEGGFGVLMNGRLRGGNLVLCGQMTRIDDEARNIKRRYLASYSETGVELVAYVERTEMRNSANVELEQDIMPPFVLAWALAPDGRVVVPSDWDSYALHVHSPDGTLERVIERTCEPWRRTDEDRRFVLRLFGLPEDAPSPIELAEAEPAIALLQHGVQVAEDGEIWVLPSRGNRGLPEGVLARFDVFGPGGHFRRQVEVRCQGDPRNDRLVLLPGDRVIRQRRYVDALVTSLGPGALPDDSRDDEDASPAVICHRIRR